MNLWKWLTLLKFEMITLTFLNTACGDKGVLGFGGMVLPAYL